MLIGPIASLNFLSKKFDGGLYTRMKAVLSEVASTMMSSTLQFESCSAVLIEIWLLLRSKHTPLFPRCASLASATGSPAFTSLSRLITWCCLKCFMISELGCLAFLSPVSVNTMILVSTSSVVIWCRMGHLFFLLVMRFWMLARLKRTVI